MARRAYGRSSREIAGFKLLMSGVLVVMLLGIGDPGSARLIVTVAVAGLLLALIVVASVFVIRSRLVRRKKVGTLLVVGAIAFAIAWFYVRAPRQWVEFRAVVMSVSHKPVETATLNVGSALFPVVATTKGPHVSSYRVGALVPVWQNPVAKNEISLVPHATVGGQRYWVIIVAGVLCAAGAASLATGRQWVDRSRVGPATPTADETREPSTPVTPSIVDMLHAIDWYQFESVSARILESEGWLVQMNGGANPDGGADLIAVRNGRRAVVQCKHWQHVEVQPKVIRELIGTRTSVRFQADEAILFTLSRCTDTASQCAEENLIKVYDLGIIAESVERIGVQRFPELLHPEEKQCPKCGALMVYRGNAATPFWGCSRYPRCRGKIETPASGDFAY